MPENDKLIVDAVSAATVVGTFVDMLPAVAAVFTILWTLIRIYETDTIQAIVNKVLKRKVVEDVKTTDPE
ncbi:MAG: hypothetical protein CMN30_31920 [Sandaracinus sp.]|nr:hypothetical protein [Sandaracinus sp.]